MKSSASEPGLRISKHTKFEGDTLKASEDIASESRQTLQGFVPWGGGGGTNLSLTIQTSVKFGVFAELYHR